MVSTGDVASAEMLLKVLLNKRDSGIGIKKFWVAKLVEIWARC